MSFSVLVEPSGVQFSVEAEESILAAGIRQGIALPYGCKEGSCGSCKCKIESGTVHLDTHQGQALSDSEAAQGLILTCRATPRSDLVLNSPQVSVEGGLPIKKMPARVADLAKLSHDVMRVRLQLPAASAFQFRAGQYMDFLMRDGSRRSYSMANAPHTLNVESPTLEFHIRHMPGGLFTEQVFSTLKQKDVLRLEGPFGSFHLREASDQPIILLASGTGFAPIKSLLENMLRQGIQRHTTLYWGGRRPQDLYLDEWVKALQAEMPHLHYVPVVSDAQPQDAWTGRTGFVHQAVLHDYPDLSDHQVYACGAPIVVDSAKRDYLTKGGLLPEAFFADSFVSMADKARASVSPSPLSA